MLELRNLECSFGCVDGEYSKISWLLMDDGSFWFFPKGTFHGRLPF